MIEVKLIGPWHRQLGRNVTIHSKQPVPIAALLDLIESQYDKHGIFPDAAEWDVHLLVVVNGSIGKRDTLVSDGDQVIITTALEGG